MELDQEVNLRKEITITKTMVSYLIFVLLLNLDILEVRFW